MSVTIVTKGIDGLSRFFDALPDIAKESARLAINDTARSAVRKLIPDAIEKEVAFPPGYLNRPDRLAVDSFASNNELTAVIKGRDAATSLARFAPGLAPGLKQPGIRVTVGTGHSITLRRAFGVRLKAGSAAVTQDNFNLGLAIRLKPGEVFHNKRIVVQSGLGDGVYILYGPSVAQVFATVADDLNDTLGDQIESEFYRQFVRLAGELQ